MTVGTAQEPRVPARIRDSLDWRVVGGLAGLVLLGLLLRLSSFTDALFGDELSTYVVVHDNDLGRMFELIHSDQEVTPPLYFILASLTEHLGDASDWLRFPPLLAALAAIPLTYLLGTRTVGKTAAMVGAALVSISPFLIYYSTEARAYGLSVVICLLSTLAMLRAIDEEKPTWWALYALLSAAAMYTHYTNLFLLAGQAAWAFVARPQARVPLLLANAGAAIVFVPWLPAYLEDSRSPGAGLLEAIHPLNFHNFRVDLSRMLIGIPYLGIRELPGDAAIAMIGTGVTAGLVGSLARIGRAGRWRPAAPLVLVAILACASVVGATLYSFVADDVYAARNLISAWPGIALLVGVIVTSAGSWISVVATGLVIAGFGVGAVMSLEADNQRPDYDAAARYLLENGARETPVVDVPFSGPGAKQALEVALDDLGAGDVSVLRVGVPTLEDAEAIRAPDGPGQFAAPPPPSGEQVADEALSQASDGRILLVAPDDLPPEFQSVFPGVAEQQAFLDALPPSYREISSTTFPGISGGVTVYELSEG